MTRNSVRDRRECFDRCKRSDEHGRIVLECHICGGTILPASEAWECEHVVPLAFNGGTTLPAHPHCHKPKTAKDLVAIAKSKRVSDQTYGVKRSSNPMPGSRRSAWKKKMDGTTVRR